MSRIEELEKKLAADPNSRIFVQLAEEYRKQGLLDNAIEICEQGLTKHPQYPSARVALGRALLEAESFDRASEEFESVLAQIPDNILANKFLGETYHRLGRYNESIQKYQIAQTLSPEDTEIEGKIEAVKAEQAAGGPVPPPPEPADQTRPAEPPEAGSATPMGLSLGAPPSPPVPAPPEPLDPTLVDARAFTDEAPEAPPPPPLPPVLDAPPVSAHESEVEPEPQEEVDPPQEELAPIPLVDVDEPMVLEGSSYSNVTTEPEPPPLERVEVISSMEAFQMAPPTPPEPAPVPDALDPNPPLVEPPSLEQSQQAPPLPPTAPLPSTDDASAVPLMDVPSALEPPPFEAPPLDAGPIQAVSPVETAAAEAPATSIGAQASDSAEAGDDIDTPTMAELYAAQGHFDKAVLVYRNLIVREPNETKYLERIEELEMLANASADSATATPEGRVEPRGDALSDAGTRETIEVLEQWLDVIRRSRRA